MELVIDNLWNGQPITDHERKIRITCQSTEKGLEVKISAPFFDDPKPPGGQSGKPYDKLWDYEVVELFFLGEKEKYLELEFAPGGEHLVLLLDGTRNMIQHSLELEYKAEIGTGQS